MCRGKGNDHDDGHLLFDAPVPLRIASLPVASMAATIAEGGAGNATSVSVNQPLNDMNTHDGNSCDKVNESNHDTERVWQHGNLSS